MRHATKRRQTNEELYITTLVLTLTNDHKIFALNGFEMLTVTAQQSRFHNEAIEGSALKEILVKDLNISIGHREILNHAEFQLQVGKHYVLVGRNGIGKSSKSSTSS